jgi:hypothetical protein
VLFVVDHDEFEQVVDSAGAAPPLPELPPLPYPRVVVECAEDATWALADENGNHIRDLELFAINETRRGESWMVCLLTRNAVTDDEQLKAMEQFMLDGPITPEKRKILHEFYGQGFSIYEVNRDGSVTSFRHNDIGLPHPDEIQTPEEFWQVLSLIDDDTASRMVEEVRHEPDDPWAIASRRLPIEFAHLVNARGVTVEEIGIHRGQRRRFTKRKLVHPQVYFVFIDEEKVESHPGHGEREYHCRWMVRGHWRQQPCGTQRRFRRLKWIDPYVKGPEDKPLDVRPTIWSTGKQVPEGRR